MGKMFPRVWPLVCFFFFNIYVLIFIFIFTNMNIQTNLRTFLLILRALKLTII
jgi:hypothetical protein